MPATLNRDYLDALVSPRYGTLPGLREGAFIERCNKPGAIVDIEALIPAFEAGTMWRGAWRFYVRDPDNNVTYVLHTTRADKPKTVVTIVGVMKMMSLLGPRKIALPIGPW